VSREIPEGWRQVQLGDISRVNMGQSPSSKEVNDSGEGIPFLQGNAEFKDRYPTPVKWCVSPLKLADKGDVLMSVRAPVGALNYGTSRSLWGIQKFVKKTS